MDDDRSPILNESLVSGDENVFVEPEEDDESIEEEEEEGLEKIEK